MTDQSSGSVPPGWYPDPAEPSVSRYWDGEGWRMETALPPVEPAVVMPPVEVAPAPQAPGRAPGGPRPPVNWPEDWPFPPPGKVSPFGRSLASPMTRIAARLLDAMVLLLLNVVINGYFAVMWWREAKPWFEEAWARAQAGESTLDVAPTERLGWLSLAILVVATLIWFAYEVPSTANTGHTLGKRIMRIQVIPTEGEGQLTLGRSFRRWNPMGMSLLTLFCCWPLAFVFPILDVIFVATDRYLHQALHDRSARTYVVNALPKSPEPKKEVRHESDSH